MKVRTLIAGAAIVFLCGGLGVCVAQEAPAPASPAAPEAAPSPASPSVPESASMPASKHKHHTKHHRRHHHGKRRAEREFTEQELQAQSPSK